MPSSPDSASATARLARCFPLRFLRHPASRVLLLAAMVLAVLAQPALAQERKRPVRPAAEVGVDESAALSAGFDFNALPEVRAFVDGMAQRHGFEPQALQALFTQARHQPEVLKLISPPGITFKRSWTVYRNRMVDPVRTREGLRFWDRHQDALARAEREFGVPAQVIVAIIGIETVYGRQTGNFRVVDALATLGFDHPRRAEYFRGELEQWLLHAREAGIDPLSARGSFAGAMGLPQFMPTSLRRFATDFDGDGRIDLQANPVDAVGSVARFLALHGWQAGGRTHYPARLAADAGVARLIEAGIEPRFTAAELAAYGVDSPVSLPPEEKLALVDLPDGDNPTRYWLGANNFYAITRYNRSSFYAMAVIDLAETLRALRPR